MQQSVKSAERVLDIIETLVQEPAGLSFTALLRALQIPKSSLHELLDVLTRRGYIALDSDTRIYTLGLHLWESGQAYLQQHDLIGEARPVMDEIVRVLNETVQLAVLDGIENVYLAKVDCTHPVRLQSEVGRRLYAHATGLGKVLLAHLPPEELMRRLDGRTLPQFTTTTITTISALLAELVVIRQNGFALDNEEYTPGLRCVAVPISDHSGRTIAAMSVSIPMLRTHSSHLSDALCLLAKGSLSLARRLGSRADDTRLIQLQDSAFARTALHHVEGDMQQAHSPAPMS